MANEEHLKVLAKGVEFWNQWRKSNPEIEPDLEYALLKLQSLDGIDFSRANLRHADLMGGMLNKANFSYANLKWVNFFDADLRNADFFRSDLGYADFRQAFLTEAKFVEASLFNTIFDNTTLFDAEFDEADLRLAIINNSDFRGVKFNNTRIGGTTFTNVDLSGVQGIENIRHEGPSSIGVDTIFRSGGKIPNNFLRGSGVPNTLIENLPSLTESMQAIQFFSCFISYSTKDEDFANLLHSRMQKEQLRVWFAPKNIQGGQKLHEQIDQAIRIYDKLLLVLSESSIQSEWVATEIRKARKTEIGNKRRKLFPIRLVDMNVIREWECFDADTGKDLAVEVREYFIPDFSEWAKPKSFEKSFSRLLHDLQSAE